LNKLLSNNSFYAKLLIFILVISLLPFIFVSWISYQNQKELITRKLQQNLHVLSQGLAVDIEHFIAERLNDAKVLADNPELRKQTIDPLKVRTEFKHFSAINPIYQGGILLNNNGIVIADKDNDMIGNDMSSRTWFNIAKKGEPYLSDIYLSPVVKRPIIALAAPVFADNGEIIRVVSPSLNIENLWKTLDEFTKYSKNFNLNTYAFLINEKGEIIAHPYRDKILRENFFQNNNISLDEIVNLVKKQKLFYDDANDTLISFSSVKKITGFNNNWYVAVAVPQAELYAPLHELLHSFIFIMILAIIFFVIILFYYSKQFTRPLEQFVVVAKKFARGIKTPKLKIDAYQELTELSLTFNEMMQELREREEVNKKSTLIIETIDSGVLTINILTREISVFNRTCEKVFALSKELVIGKKLNEISSLHKFKDLYLFLQQAQIEQKLAGIFPDKVEFKANINKQVRYFIGSFATLKDEEGDEKYLVFTFLDITEQKLMERELIRSEKLKLVGQIAAGFVHELKNPLTVIQGSIQVISKKMNSCDEKIAKYNEMIMSELERIKKIIQQYLTLAKPEEENVFKTVNINEVIKQLITILEPQFWIEKIKIVEELQELPLILTNENYVKQVLINIIQNAKEAMEIEGGTLTIRNWFNDERVYLSISDTGKGIKAEDIAKIGREFFTTKELGTGIGMVISYRLIHDLGGTIEVQSEENKGTTFIITLPYSKQAQKV